MKAASPNPPPPNPEKQKRLNSKLSMLDYTPDASSLESANNLNSQILAKPSHFPKPQILRGLFLGSSMLSLEAMNCELRQAGNTLSVWRLILSTLFEKPQK